MGRGSLGYLVAQLAVETGIPPQYLLDLDTAMFRNLLQVFNDKAEVAKNASASKGRARNR